MPATTWGSGAQQDTQQGAMAHARLTGSAFRGGFDLLADALVPASMTKFDLRALLEVDVVGWGSVPLQLEESFAFSESRAVWFLDPEVGGG